MEEEAWMPLDVVVQCQVFVMAGYSLHSQWRNLTDLQRCRCKLNLKLCIIILHIGFHFFAHTHAHKQNLLLYATLRQSVIFEDPAGLKGPGASLVWGGGKSVLQVGLGIQKINCRSWDLVLTRRTESTNESEKKIKAGFYNSKAKTEKPDIWTNISVATDQDGKERDFAVTNVQSTDRQHAHMGHFCSISVSLAPVTISVP